MQFLGQRTDFHQFLLSRDKFKGPPSGFETKRALLGRAALSG